MFDPNADWRHFASFDRNCFDVLDSETGGAGGDVAAAFARIAPVRKQAMLAAADRRDIQELGRLAHAAKSGAKSLGLLRLAALCDRIERGPVDIVALGPILAQEFDAALTALLPLGGE